MLCTDASLIPSSERVDYQISNYDVVIRRLKPIRRLKTIHLNSMLLAGFMSGYAATARQSRLHKMVRFKL